MAAVAQVPILLETLSPEFTQARANLRNSSRDEANSALHSVIAACRGKDSVHAFNTLAKLVTAPEDILRFEAELPEHREATAHFRAGMLERAASALFDSTDASERAAAVRYHCNAHSNAVMVPTHTRDRIIATLERIHDVEAIASGIEFLRRYTSIIRDEQYDVDPSLRNDPKTDEAILSGKTSVFIQGVRSTDPQVQIAFISYADSHAVLFTPQEWHEVIEMAKILEISADDGVRTRAENLLSRHTTCA